MVGLDSAGKVSQSLEGCVVQQCSMTEGLSSGEGSMILAELKLIS